MIVLIEQVSQIDNNDIATHWDTGSITATRITKRAFVEAMNALNFATDLEVDEVDDSEVEMTSDTFTWTTPESIYRMKKIG